MLTLREQRTVAEAHARELQAQLEKVVDAAEAESYKISVNDEWELRGRLVEPVKIDPDRQTPARQEMRRRAVARVVDFRSHKLAGRHHAISRSSAGRRG